MIEEEARRLLYLIGLKPYRKTLPGEFLAENFW